MSDGGWGSVAAGHCEKCGSEIRRGVSLSLDIPITLDNNLSKKRLRRRDVRILGADWCYGYYYCPKGCYALQLTMKAHEKYKKEIEELKAEIQRLQS